MSCKNNYVYHIITSTDLSELINCCQAYPIVHHYHETCTTKRRPDEESLKLSDVGEGLATTGVTKPHPPPTTPTTADERGNIPEAELEGIQKSKH